jgi:hypothetical protein
MTKLKLLSLMLFSGLSALAADGASSGGGASILTEADCEFPLRNGYYLFQVAEFPYFIGQNGDAALLKVVGPHGKEEIASSIEFNTTRVRTDDSMSYSDAANSGVKIKLWAGPTVTASDVSRLRNVGKRWTEIYGYSWAKLTVTADGVDEISGLCHFGR